MSRSRVRYVYLCRFEQHPVFLTRAQFLRLPKATRALLVVRDEVELLDGRGFVVPLHEALADLRETWSEHTGLELVSSRDPQTERRAHARFPFVRSAEVNGRDAAVIQDISRGGMLLRSRRTYELGDTLDVRWDAAYADPRETRFVAVVKRVASDPPERGSLFPVTIAVELRRASLSAAV